MTDETNTNPEQPNTVDVTVTLTKTVLPPGAPLKAAVLLFFIADYACPQCAKGARISSRDRPDLYLGVLQETLVNNCDCGLALRLRVPVVQIAKRLGLGAKRNGKKVVTLK